MKVVRDDLWFCDCCSLAAVNGDSCECDDEHDDDVVKGLDDLGPHVVPDFDSNDDEGIEEFSWKECDCCGTRLGGSRHRFAVLGEEGTGS